MKRKIYKLLSSVKQGLLALALTVFSDMAYSQTTYTFNYTGSVQTINLQPGNYEIECWGADGGSTAWKSGGKGGYSKGILTLLSAETVSVYVAETGHTNSSVTTPPSFGGGGGVGAYSSSYIGNGASGGGASDVRVLIDDLYHRIIVGGGGGGANSYGNGSATYSGNGGDGGGVNGANGLPGTGTTYGPGFGGTQTAGGAIGTGAAGSTPGIFGAGGSCTIVLVGTGGGGGWYGGGASYAGGGAGGGSGYVLTATSFKPAGYFSQNPSYYLANDVTAGISQTGFVTKPTVPVAGNGLVYIKELCNITLSHNAAGTQSVAQLCSGQSLTITTNAISNYSWSTGDVTSSLVVSPTSNTVYALTATSPSNCTASSQISVVVNGSAPVLSVTQSTNQTCLGKTATLTASGAITYTWTNGVTNGVSFNPQTTTTYTVSGQNGCGITTAVSTISVNPLPVSVVSTGTAVCTNKTATLSVTAAATSYTWQPNNSMGTSTSVIVNPQANTIYTVTASDGTCSGVANISLQANPAPTIMATSSSTGICPGGAVTLSVTGGNNYTWSPTNQNGNSITVTPTASTLYSVIGDNGFGCLNSSSQVVILGSIPNFVLNASATSICLGNTSTLTVNNATATYVWSNGPTGNTNVVSPTQNTTYTVIATNPASNCSDEKSVAVTVYEPMVSITGNTAVCNGQEISLSATAAGATGYTWNPGGPFQTINTTPGGTTIYTISTTSSSNNITCPVQGTFQVIVNPVPTVTFSAAKPAVCKGETNTLTASGAVSYMWTNGTTTASANSITITSAVPAILVYSVTGVDANGCEATISMPLTISACVGLEQLSSDQSQLVVYPNPNNGEFTIQGSADMDLKLVNQLGQVIKQIQIDETNNRKVYLTGLSNGIYFLVGENVSHKVIINK